MEVREVVIDEDLALTCSDGMWLLNSGQMKIPLEQDNSLLCRAAPKEL